MTHKLFDMQLKLLMIGDSGVGKTCLLIRFANQTYSPSFITTIGVDFKTKILRLDDGKRVKLQIWDTARQERFRTITTFYFCGAHGIMLVYDVTDRKTFIAIQSWMNQIDIHADVHVNKFLVGNKCDVEEDQRAVSYDEGKALAKEYNICFYETSAKQNINVDESFTAIASDVAKKIIADVGVATTGVSFVGGPGTHKNRICC